MKEQYASLHQLWDIRQKKLNASSPYGPVRAGLIPMPVQETDTDALFQRLTELLNSLEKQVETLNFKSFTVYDTFNTAIEDLRAALSIHTEDAGTNKICYDCGNDLVAEGQEKCLECLES